jgi:translation initiation factor 2B subunit (eIF-2B alpha/beta/delta family)
VPDPLPPSIQAALSAIAADTSSGATAVVLRGIAALRQAADNPYMLAAAARGLVGAQPVMAGLRTAAAVALSADDPGLEMDRLAERIRRAGPAIARVAAPLIRMRRQTGRPLTVVTISRSALVERTLLAVARDEPLRVCCAESQPGGEGVALARALARQGVDAAAYADSAIGSEVDAADAVVVGADAVGPAAFVNKAGSAGVSALAQVSGVPLVVLAGREKLVPAAVFDALPVEGGRGQEGSAGLLHRRLFERIRHVSPMVVTDAGAGELSAVESMSF